MNENSYPLSWPVGWKRTLKEMRWYPRFGPQRRGLSISEGIDRLMPELDRLGARNIILSTNVRFKANGSPYSNERDPDDPGVAVFFALDRHQTVLACDKWLRVADNIGAIAKHIEALRGQERW